MILIKWEYKDVTYGTRAELLEELNKLGAEGWEYVEHILHSSASYNGIVFLRRPVRSVGGIL